MKKSIGPHTILHPHPVLLVGTYDEEGKANLCTVAWGGICCSNPPSLYVALRKATKTYGSILSSRAFTVNIPSVSQLKEADYVGIVSGKDVDKFEKTAWTAVKAEHVNAPFVEETPLSLECKLRKSVEVGLHTMFIGEIVDIKAHEEVLTEKELPDISKVKPMVYATGNMAYFAVGEELGRAFKNRDL